MADDKLKQAAARALAWLEKANAPGDAGEDFLNDDGVCKGGDAWGEAETIEDDLRDALHPF
jgi:hypothetical protein